MKNSISSIENRKDRSEENRDLIKFLLKNANISLDSLIRELKIEGDDFELPHFREIRMEMTNLCGCHCFCCPREKMTRKTGIVSIEDLNLILDRVDYIDYEIPIHLHGYGEALLVKDLPERIALIKNRKSNFKPFIITTLGYDRNYDYFSRLFQNGLNFIYISCYGYYREDYKLIHGLDSFDLVKRNLEYITKLRKEFNFGFHIALDGFGEMNPEQCKINHDEKQKDFIDFLNSIGIPEAEISFCKLHNFGSTLNAVDTNNTIKPCSACYGSRAEQLNINWNLDIIPCCMDFNSSVIFGNLREQALKEIYSSKARKKLIVSLIENSDDLPEICRECQDRLLSERDNIKYQKIMAYLGLDF